MFSFLGRPFLEETRESRTNIPVEFEFLGKRVVEIGGCEFFVDLRVKKLVKVALVAGPFYWLLLVMHIRKTLVIAFVNQFLLFSLALVYDPQSGS